MSHQTAILLSVAIPFAGAILIMLSGLRPNVRETITILAGLALFLVVVSLLPDVAAGARPSLTLIPLFGGVPLKFAVEPLGMLFALVASGLWVVTSIYAFGYMRAEHEHDQTRFYACFAIAIASTMGLAFSGNLLTLFLFYEVLTLSTYPLVTHHGDDDARRGGRVYLGILIATSIGLLLPAILVTLYLTGTLDFTPGGILAGKASTPLTAVLLLAYVYGIGKAALMPSTAGCRRRWSRRRRSARSSMRSPWSRRACSRSSRCRSTSSAWACCRASMRRCGSSTSPRRPS